MINLEAGTIEFFRNGMSLGVAFEEGAKAFKKGNLYPLVQLYKTKVSVFQMNEPVMINTKCPLESSSPTPQQKMEEVYGKGAQSNSLIQTTPVMNGGSPQIIQAPNQNPNGVLPQAPQPHSGP
mmetsp:Transcript_2022/g.3014  ORF Transcript_2022/g.3014 Transcript_2022/m.3014 type:complete len:123 (+) Transcript_2022:967-1335(+)